MTIVELGAIAKGLAPVLHALVTRIAVLEAKPHVKFCGVYRHGATYAPGDAVTHHGGLWVCQVPTPGEPSRDFVGWQLAVKKGHA